MGYLIVCIWDTVNVRIAYDTSPFNAQSIFRHNRRRTVPDCEDQHSSRYPVPTLYLFFQVANHTIVSHGNSKDDRFAFDMTIERSMPHNQMVNDPA